MYGPCQHTVVGRVWWVKRPPCSLLERIRFRRTAVSKHVHEKKSYNCSSKNCSNILHVQTQNCWQKFSHVLRDCHVKLSSQEIKAYHTGVRRDSIYITCARPRGERRLQHEAQHHRGSPDVTDRPACIKALKPAPGKLPSHRTATALRQ